MVTVNTMACREQCELKPGQRMDTDSCLESELTKQASKSQNTCSNNDIAIDGEQQSEKICLVDNDGAKPKTKLKDIQKVSDKPEGADEDLSKISEDKVGANLSWIQRTDAFIAKTVEFAQVNVKCTKAEQISRAVYECVKTILHDIAEDDSNFQSSEILEVGSFYEGTKILEPDEFDFLVVIDELSQPGAIAVVTNDIRPGYAEVLLTDETLKKRWIHTKESGVLHNFQESERPRSFSAVALSSLAKKAEEQSLEYELSEFGYINLKGAPISFPPVGNITLMLKYAESWNPNFVLNFQYDEMTISVDISPAIRYHNVADSFNPEDCINKKLAEAVLNRGSILLVNHKTLDNSDKDPAHEHVFRITFTETELLYIKNMCQDHKLIYIFLKYVSDLFRNVLKPYYPDANKTLSTYLLKLACLFHDLHCEQQESSLLTFCLYMTLPVFFSWYISHQYTSVFNTKLLVCTGSKHIVDTYRKMLDFLIDFCTHKIEVPEFIETKFNPAPFIESKMKEIYTSRDISIVEKRKEFILPLIDIFSLTQNPEQFLRETKSKGANTKETVLRLGFLSHEFCSPP